MTDCCDLGRILDSEREILYETDNFFVTPTLGPMGIEGYLLVLSKEHFKGVGDLPFDLHQELDDVVITTRRRLEEAYGLPPLVFEHGPSSSKTTHPSCHDHMHLHVAPTADIRHDLVVDRIDGFKRMAEILERRKSSYLFVESPDNFRFVTEVDFYIPSQYCRRLVAEQQSIVEWDWKKHPDLKTIRRTTEKSTGRF